MIPMQKNQLLNKKNLLLLLSFTEGGCVMAAELIGAKLMTPFFGTSLYVWSAVLASTLIALASGYFVGGVLSSKSGRIEKLLLIALAGGIFMMLMPFSIKFVLALFGSFNIMFSIIGSGTLLLIPPLFMMGCISPLIIAELSEENNQAGYVSGTIYAVSTVGGILFTFLFGFFIIPVFGLKIPALVTGALFASIPVIIFFFRKKINIVLIFTFTFALSAYYTFKNNTSSRVKILYEKEGMLGKITVADYIPKDSNDVYNGRLLMINNITQTYISFNKTKSLYYDYHEAMIDIAKTYPENASVLQLGLGGGTLAQSITNSGHDVEVCEIDSRIHAVAKKYFGLSDKIKVHIDDARHYINQLQKQRYNIVILDLFKGEEHPYHVFTLESFQKLKQHLNSEAVILMNIHGYLEGSVGKGNRALFKTLGAAGFQYKIIPQGYSSENPDRRVLLVIASADTQKLQAVSEPFRGKEIALSESDLAADKILRDDYPNGDLLFAEAAKRWRMIMLANAMFIFGN